MTQHTRVTKLAYRVTLQDTDVSGLLPQFWEHEVGRFSLADGTLTVEPKQRFSDHESAHNAVQPWLRSFAIGHHLTDGRRIHFELESSVTQHPAHDRIDWTVHVTLGVSARASLDRHRQGVRYPQPLNNCVTNEDVETAYQRWDNYRRDREPLPGVAYFVLTLLEERAGSRRKASMRFRIARNVLDRVGELSSVAGTPTTARKADHREMTPEEATWLKQAIESVILRLGCAEQLPDRITMDDLPPLGQRPRG